MREREADMLDSAPDAVPVFEVSGVTKTYGRDKSRANDNLSLSIFPGEIFGILGDNGAGKSTLIRQMVGLLVPTAGQIRFLGIPVANAERELTTMVGYMPQSAFALNNLTVREAIFFTARFRGCSRPAARDEAARLLALWGIESLAGRVARQLSGGQRRLLQLAVTMAASPPVLIMDEPTNDLDPVNRKLVWRVLSSVNAAGATIIFVTHDAIEAEKVVRRIAIMRNGRIVATGRPADLKREVDNRFRLELTGDPANPPHLPPGVSYSALEPGRWLAVLDKEAVGPVLANLEVYKFDDVRLSSATLEDLYLYYALKS
jgi:ABC-2 type transport system ATP-binding protein